MRIVVVSMCVFLETLRIAQPRFWLFDNIWLVVRFHERAWRGWRIVTRPGGSVVLLAERP
jgi:hypothetical protein